MPAEIFNAILCMHGGLTPNYSYIADLRAINEKVKAQQAELRKELEEEEANKSPKKRGLARNLSLVTLSLQGHLFDTKCFNQCLDICEKNKIQFRVIGWEVGNFQDQPSTVSIQMMASDKNLLNATIDEIEEITQKLGVEILEGESEHDVNKDFNKVLLFADKS